jgi:CBS domain-containing protein
MSDPAVTVSPETPVKDAAQVLVERDFSALPVVDGDGALVGIVTEADLIRLEGPDPRAQLRAGGRGPAPATVAEVMSPDVITVEAGADLSVAADLMIQAAVKHLPVVVGSRLVGILSRHDIVRVIAAPDRGVQERVRAVLAGEGTGLVAAQVAVDHGVVVVSGVTNPRTRGLADSLVRSVPGVLDVRFTETSA